MNPFRNSGLYLFFLFDAAKLRAFCKVSMVNVPNDKSIYPKPNREMPQNTPYFRHSTGRFI